MKRLVFDTQKISEAQKRLLLAKGALEGTNRPDLPGHPDNAGCIRESQAAVELISKALFDFLEFDYRHDHDVSRDISEAILKFQQDMGPENSYWPQRDLCRAIVASRVLNSLKLLSVYGDEKTRISASDLFLEFGSLAKECYQLAEVVVDRLSKLMREMMGQL